jgi:hypothetical protein
MSVPGQVICRSDHAYIGYPLAFYWQDQRLEVSEVLLEYHSPTGYTFRVRTHESGIFELVYDLRTDQWSVRQQ